MGKRKLELDKIGLTFLLGKILSLVINLVTFPRLFFLNKVHENLETVRSSYIDKRGIENKQKPSFLLISANKDSLCLDIETYFLSNSNYLSINL